MRGHTEHFELPCGPEDANCKEAHGPEVICKECDAPVCYDCYGYLNRSKDVPMALANDNMWGYATDLITRYQVRWIEMAAVLPYWTTMIVYYVK